MDASCNIQEDIHVLRLNHNMCPGFWVHIIQGPGQYFFMILFNDSAVLKALVKNHFLFGPVLTV